MQIVVCVAHFDNEPRFLGVLNEGLECNRAPGDVLVVVNTGAVEEKFSENEKTEYSMNCTYRSILNKKRRYASVMKAKVETCLMSKFTKEEFIFMNLDDDMSLNPHALSFARLIFEENPHVDYLSLLRGPGVMVNDMNEAYLSGFRFFRHPSTLGGAIIARWSTFKRDVTGFFDQNSVTEDDAGSGGMFDQSFFFYLKRSLGRSYEVYTLRDFSLVQHCNLVSSYSEERKDLLSHMYAINYDPRMNPMSFQGAR